MEVVSGNSREEASRGVTKETVDRIPTKAFISPIRSETLESIHVPIKRIYRMLFVWQPR